MMEYFRAFLITLRKKENENSKVLFSTKLLIAGVIGVITGVILDILLPFNFILNMLRGVVANVSGVAMFSYGYILADKIGRNRLAKNRYYKTFRKRLSYRQRINVSIFLGAITAFFVLLSSKYTAAFTLKSSVAIFVALSLVTFSRKDRNEFLKNIYNIPDLKDVEFITRKAKKKDKKKDK